MCLFPRLIENRKYRATKKNGGVIPAIKDHRTRYVPIGCQTCIECRKQKAREWMARLQEDIKVNKNAKFITLTFSTESIVKLCKEDEKLSTLKGYDLDNGLCVRATRLFLERWRKKYKRSLRHWFVTELGSNQTEHVHIHGIVWTDNLFDVEKLWGYGYVWIGNNVNGKLENYVNARTVNYITKYVTKMDEKHLNYKPIILTSPGIGNSYTKTGDYRSNKFAKLRTNEAYRTSTGHKISLPIYWRNKIYNEDEREQLWVQKLDRMERYVCGEKVSVADNEDTYFNLLHYHRARTKKLGYPDPHFIWSKKSYEESRRRMLQEKRLKDAGYI